MKANHTAVLLATALCAGLMSEAATSAADLPKSGANAPAADEIIVRAKALEKLRFEIKRSEEAVYARFNDINSNDLYDIHCYVRRRVTSHINTPVCLSNAWRKFDQAIADSTIRGMQSASLGSVAGTSTGFVQASRANQLATEQKIKQEMGELAHSDPALRAAVMHLGQTYQAEELMTGLKSFRTLEWEMPSGEKGLPFQAQHLFQVRIGLVDWVHPLTSRSFTLGSVTGRIRDLSVACGKMKHRLKYAADVDWTLPDAWGQCTLNVRATRETTFALYEFE
ncbi:MAG: hypothetical protein ABI640_04120 [Gammaproteobacteria bacterium]